MRNTTTRSAEVVFIAAVAVALAVVLGAPFVLGPPADTASTQESFDLDTDLSHTQPSVPETGTATVNGTSFDSAQAAVDAAATGQTVILEGTFEERVTVQTDEVTVRSSDAGAAIDGGDTGRVLTVDGEDVTVDGIWLRGSGASVGDEDAGVFVNGTAATLSELYISESAFGVWVNGVDNITVEDSRIEGREDVYPVVQRGNGIHLWRTANTTLRNNEITDVRDGIYYSWAEGVVSENNTMWNTRYGVHYMYSNDNRLDGNLAVDNDVGYALMVSERLTVTNNTAARNSGESGHGILLKDIEDSTVRDNTLIENSNGLYLYNAQNNWLSQNLLLRNEVGAHSTAGSSGQTVTANSFVHSDEPVVTTTQEVEDWNGTDRGNYWSSAGTVDLNHDGTSEVRHRPAGMVEHVVSENPQAAVFAESPAFDAVRLAESSFPVLEAPGVVDHRPLVEPPPEDWREYAHSG